MAVAVVLAESTHHSAGGEAPTAERPALLLEVLPQERHGRHCGIGFTHVLDTAVPQLGREMDEQIVDTSCCFEAFERSSR